MLLLRMKILRCILMFKEPLAQIKMILPADIQLDLLQCTVMKHFTLPSQTIRKLATVLK